jgi:hypothetical protein
MGRQHPSRAMRLMVRGDSPQNSATCLEVTKGSICPNTALRPGPEAEDRMPMPDHAGINIVLGTQATV